MIRELLASIILICTACLTNAQSKRELFNGSNLEGWETFIGPKDQQSQPYGLNNDPLKIFSVVDQDGAKCLRISGEINASIATKEEFENYHLTLVFKWGEKIYTKRNSGLLYHSYGNFGEGLGVWMSAHELQLRTGNMGDSYCMGNSYFEIPCVKTPDGKGYVYSPGADPVQFGEGKASKICAKNADYEKSAGEWNIIELYCFGGTSVHVVNGRVNMVNYNSGKLVNGKAEPLHRGKIQLQSEGAELFVKKVTLEKIDHLPAEFLK